MKSRDESHADIVEASRKSHLMLASDIAGDQEIRRKSGLDAPEWHFSLLVGQAAALATIGAIVSKHGDGALALKLLHEQIDHWWTVAQRHECAGQS